MYREVDESPPPRETHSRFFFELDLDLKVR